MSQSVIHSAKTMGNAKKKSDKAVKEQFELYHTDTLRGRQKRNLIRFPLQQRESNTERARLENRYADLFVERLDCGRLVTYVPNKRIPVYNWFKYKEGFSRPLVVKLVQHLGLKRSASIYDPFAGCGTTLLAGRELGLKAIGTDILPVAVFVSKVKTSVLPDCNTLLRAVKELFDEAFCEPRGSFPRIKIIDLAFPQEVQRQILFFKEAIEKFPPAVRDFLKLGLLTILEDVSQTSKDGQFLRLVHKPLPNVREALRATLTSMISDLSTLLVFAEKSQGTASIAWGDARELCLPKRYFGKIDAVITSPPYLNRYDYSRSYALELCLLNVKSHEDMVLCGTACCVLILRVVSIWGRNCGFQPWMRFSLDFTLRN
jgi:hypothetical protein